MSNGNEKLIGLRNKWLGESQRKIPASKMPTVIQFLNMMVNGDISSPYEAAAKKPAPAKPKKKAAPAKPQAKKKKK